MLHRVDEAVLDEWAASTLVPRRQLFMRQRRRFKTA